MTVALGSIGVALMGRSALPYRVGDAIPQPRIARVEFRRPNSLKTEELRQSRRAATPNFYEVNRALIGRIVAELEQFWSAFRAAETYDDFKAAASPDWPLSREDFERLKQVPVERADESFKTALEELSSELLSERIYDPKSRDERGQAAGLAPAARPPASAAVIVDEQGNESAPGDIADFTAMTRPMQVDGRAAALSQDFKFPIGGVQSVVKHVLASRLTAEPLLIHLQSLTFERIKLADETTPQQFDVFEKGKAFVVPRPDGGLTAVDIELWGVEEAAWQAFLASDQPGASEARTQQWLERLGLSVVLAALSVGLFAYVGVYQHRILEIRARTIAFGLLILGMVLVTRLLDIYAGIKELTLAPVLAAGSILTIAYSRRFAAGAMTIAGLMAVITARGDLALFASLALSVSVTVYMLNEIRTRTHIMTTGVLTAMILLVITWSFGFLAQPPQELKLVINRGWWAFAAAIASAMFVTAVLPYIERAFKIATALTLLEWRDPTRPLLQRLAREAPGTYNHSLVLGTMAEAACEAIGANGLLAQVGALYHDVGKILKPDYFAENQQSSINRHDHLAPSMSLLIIVGHVKDGVEMAKEYNLPRVLHQFIEEHHGTTLVKYFHHVASQKQPQIACGKHDRAVSEVEFRYPGPRPRSKETAVLMLCDGVEGAVRALSEPSAGRIESLVHQIVMDRLNDGQFDDCDITLKELHRVEESLVKSLVRFYHGRVKYPGGSKVRERSPPEEPQEGSPTASSSRLGTAEQPTSAAG